MLRAGDSAERPPFAEGLLFNQTPSHYTVIEVPHPKSDVNSEVMGVEAFEKSDAMALFVAGAHRFAIDKPSARDESTHLLGKADVAHQESLSTDTLSGFQVAHKAVLSLAGKALFGFVQFHGDGEAAYDVVVSSAWSPTGSTVAKDNALSNRVRDRLIAATRTGATVDTAAFPNVAPAGSGLQGTKNLQAKTCYENPDDPAKRSMFVHVEASFAMRSETTATAPNLPRNQLLARRVLSAVDDYLAGVEGGLARVLPPAGIPAVMGFDKDTWPDFVDGMPATAVPTDETALNLAYHGSMSFVGYHLESPYYSTFSPNYVSGVGKAISQKNMMWSGKRERLASVGYRVLPLYFGPYDKTNLNADITTVQRDNAARDAKDAHDLANREGFPAETHIYLDVENSYAISATSNSRLRTYIENWARWFADRSTGKNASPSYKIGFYCGYFNCDDIKAIVSPIITDVRYWVHHNGCTPYSEPAVSRNYPGSPGCKHYTRFDNGFWTKKTFFEEMTGVAPSRVQMIGGAGYASVWQFATSDPGSSIPEGCGGSQFGYGSSHVCWTRQVGQDATFNAFVDLNSMSRESSSIPGLKPRNDIAITIPAVPMAMKVYFADPTEANLVHAAGQMDVEREMIQSWKQIWDAGGPRVLHDRLIGSASYVEPNPDGVLQNASFEDGDYFDFPGWTAIGVHRVTSETQPIPHLFAMAAIRATTVVPQNIGPPVAYSGALEQEFNILEQAETLSFLYYLQCQADATSEFRAELTDRALGTTHIIAQQMCGVSNGVARPNYSLLPHRGHTVLLKFTMRDLIAADGWDTQSLTFLDDVDIDGLVLNRDFERGDYEGWTAPGGNFGVVVTHPANYGTHSLRLGSPGATQSFRQVISQEILVPLGATAISLNYQAHCNGADRIGAKILDALGSISERSVFDVCTNEDRWTFVRLPVADYAGRRVTLQLYADATNASYAYFDDIHIEQ